MLVQIRILFKVDKGEYHSDSKPFIWSLPILPVEGDWITIHTDKKLFTPKMIYIHPNHRRAIEDNTFKFTHKEFVLAKEPYIELYYGDWHKD